MKEIKHIALLILFILSSKITDAQTWIGFELDRSQIIAQKDSFNIINLSNHKIGSMVLETKYEGSKYIMSDVSIIDGLIREESSYEFNKETLGLEKFNIIFEQGPMIVVGNLTWNGNHAVGYYQMNSNERTKKIEVDSIFTSNLIDRGEVFAFIQGLPLKVGLKTSFPVLAQPNYEIWNMTLEVVSEETCIVPAGEFKAYRINFLGNSVSNIIYVTQSKPHRIIKVDVIGQPMKICISF